MPDLIRASFRLLRRAFADIAEGFKSVIRSAVDEPLAASLAFIIIGCTLVALGAFSG